MKQEDFYGLSYSTPAAQWVEALPLGNAKLGGMIYGSLHDEIIQINEETVWAGYPRCRDNPEAYNRLSKIRESIFQGDYDGLPLSERIRQTNRFDHLDAAGGAGRGDSGGENAPPDRADQ